MPATAKKPAKKSTKPSTKAIAAAVKPAPAVKPARKPRKPVEPTVEEQQAAQQQARSQAISTAMLELSEVRKVAREARGGTPVKWVLFDLWFKALTTNKAFDVAAMATKYPEIKASTLRAWHAGWRRGRVPSNGKGKEKAIAAAIKKGSAA